MAMASIRLWSYSATAKSTLLPPANVVCEGYVFTGICDSVNRGGVRGFIRGGMRGFIRGVHGFIRGGMCGFIWGCAWFYSGGACMVLFGGRAWFYLGGMHGFIQGACMVLFGGACVVLFGGACVVLSGGDGNTSEMMIQSIERELPVVKTEKRWETSSYQKRQQQDEFSSIFLCCTFII